MYGSTGVDTKSARHHRQQHSATTSTSLPPQHQANDLSHLFPQFHLPSPERQFAFTRTPRTPVGGQKPAAATSQPPPVSPRIIRRVIPPTPQTPIKPVGLLDQRPQWGSSVRASSKSKQQQQQQRVIGNRPSTAPTANKASRSQQIKTPRTAPGNNDTPRKVIRTTQLTLKNNNSKLGRSPRRNSNAPLNVVLPPRVFSVSSVEEEQEDERTPDPDDDIFPKITVTTLHFESSYTPHKSHWIKNALMNLGSTWIREGKTTYEQLMSEEFEEKMGVFYDLAMAKKHEAIDRLVDEVGNEVDVTTTTATTTQKQQPTRVNKKGKVGTNSSVNKRKVTTTVIKSPKPMNRRTSSSTTTTTTVTNSSAGMTGSTPSTTSTIGSVQKNFPFAEHLTATVKASMSDALLRIITRDDDSNKSSKAQGSKTRSKKKSKDHHESSSNNNNESQSSNNSFDRELWRRYKNLVQCYVLDGGKLVIGTKNGLLGVGGSFVNKFGDSRNSRVRKSPRPVSFSELGYYRRVANMMGFLPHEVKIRYCQSSRKIVVSGARPQRGNENARQVREVLELPKSVDVRNLVVLRTTKGSLIFEELEENSGEQLERGSASGQKPSSRKRSKPNSRGSTITRGGKSK